MLLGINWYEKPFKNNLTKIGKTFKRNILLLSFDWISFIVA